MKDISVIIQVVVILAVTGLIVVLVNHFFNRFIARREKLYQKFIKSILTFIIIVIGVYAALSQFEIARTISTSLLQSGSLIIAVATFAAQQALGNVISGFFISATKPCEIGQKVKIMSGGNVIAEGIVRDMTVRHIFIEQFDGQSYMCPIVLRTVQLLSTLTLSRMWEIILRLKSAMIPMWKKRERLFKRFVMKIQEFCTIKRPRSW